MLEDGAGIRDLYNRYISFIFSSSYCPNTYLEGVHLALTSSVGNLSVVENDTVAAGTTTSLGPANALGELGIGVTEEEDVVIFDTVGLAPGAHDEGIVVGEHGNHIDTLGLELGKLLDVLGHVSSRADRGEGTLKIISIHRRVHKKKKENSIPGRAKKTTFLSAHFLEAL